MLILASSSPRRRELLTQVGFPFRVVSLLVEEGRHSNEDPILYTQRLARAKAEIVFQAQVQAQALVKKSAPKSSPSSPAPTHAASAQAAHNLAAPSALSPSDDYLLVLGADTIVVCDEHVLGKPANPQDAHRMLRLLSGRTHQVITGVCLISAVGVEVAAETTSVTMLTLSDQEILDYIATGEPVDKAGAYAVQGRAGRWIPRISGCYFNVVGLPLALVSHLMEGMKAKLNANPTLVSARVPAKP